MGEGERRRDKGWGRMGAGGIEVGGRRVEGGGIKCGARREGRVKAEVEESGREGAERGGGSGRDGGMGIGVVGEKRIEGGGRSEGG